MSVEKCENTFIEENDRFFNIGFLFTILRAFETTTQRKQRLKQYKAHKTYTKKQVENFKLLKLNGYYIIACNRPQKIFNEVFYVILIYDNIYLYI